MLAAPIWAPVALGVKRLVPLIFVLLDPETISTLAGSNSHVPAPNPPWEFTEPKACRLFLLDVSTKPPSPFVEPTAEMSPEKLVYSSLHTITLPPSPLFVALALI